MNPEPLPTRPVLIQLGELIDELCKGGESVNAIAIRAGVHRDLVSRLRNRNYRSSPSLANIESICDAIGYQMVLHPKSSTT